MSEVSVLTEEHLAGGTLLGPLPSNPDALALLTWRCSDESPKHFVKVNLKEDDWLCRVLPARSPREQSLEVVAKAGQLFLRATRDVGAGEELRAWFGPEISEVLKLPTIPPIVIEGEKRYVCALCNEHFYNPHPVVAHLMYHCKRRESAANPSVKKRMGVKNFDIATLTDMDDGRKSPVRSFQNEGKKSPERILELIPDSRIKEKESLRESHDLLSESRIETETLIQNKSFDVIQHDKDKIRDLSHETNNKNRKRLDNLNAYASSPKKLKVGHSDRRPSDDSPRSSPRKPSFDLSPPYNSSETESNNTSAFKKVDKSNGQSIHSGISSLSSIFVGGSLDPRDLLFQNNFAPFHPYPLPNSVTSSSPYSHNVVSLSQAHPGIPLETSSAFLPSVKLSGGGGSSVHQQLSKLTAGVPVNLQMKMADDIKGMRKLQESQYELSALSGGRPPGMHAPLMSFLPPSLAALSFPSQNWCAKCNAHFRMTSDLVYHMRSHHKRETDPGRLRREEKLRCNICNETFRERHHLTRHMTSHQ